MANEKIFDTHGEDGYIDGRSGQRVTVLRELNEAEIEIALARRTSLPKRMFRIRFPDGFVTDAFERELVDCPPEKPADGCDKTGVAGTSTDFAETDRTYIVTETCPNCENEIEMRWDTDERGYEAVCPVCGGRLMLCDECLHSEDNPGGKCDYNSKTDSCWRRKKLNLWMRLGVALEITRNEAAVLLGYDDKRACETLKKIVSEGRFTPIGNSYIPGSSITVFNNTYGTFFADMDTDFDI